jgi:hypothetical protein
MIVERKWISAVIVAATLMCVLAPSDAGVLVPIPPVAGGSATYIRVINNNNLVAGSYVDPGGALQGFVGTLDGDYTTFAAIGGNVIVGGLNDDGYITGTSEVFTGDCLYFGCPFLRKPDGTIRRIVKDKMPLDAAPGQLTDHRTFIGQYAYRDNQGTTHLGAFYGKNTRYVRDFSFPYGPSAQGLSEDGSTVTGWTSAFDGPTLGFIAKDRVVALYEYPDDNAFETRFAQTNDNGLIAGGWFDQGETLSRAFLFDSGTGDFMPIDIPGARYAFASSVNDAGITTLIVDQTSYIYCPHKKTCPITVGAIEVPDRWISARPVKVAPVCEHDCNDKAETHTKGAEPRRFIEDARR